MSATVDARSVAGRAQQAVALVLPQRQPVLAPFLSFIGSNSPLVRNRISTGQCHFKVTFWLPPEEGVSERRRSGVDHTRSKDDAPDPSREVWCSPEGT